MCLCRNCNDKLDDKGILKNDELCDECRKIVEVVVESEIKTLATL